MDKNHKKSLQGDVKDHLANERTFLAWMRTSIGLMAFGFVVEKFAYFIKEVGYFLLKEKAPHTDALQSHSSLFGIGIIAVGALLGLFSYIGYRKTTKQIEQSCYLPSPVLSAALATLVVLMGIILVVYLLIT
jgi:inner membrane protein YidH